MSTTHVFAPTGDPDDWGKRACMDCLARDWWPAPQHPDHTVVTEERSTPSARIGGDD